MVIQIKKILYSTRSTTSQDYDEAYIVMMMKKLQALHLKK